MSESGAQALRTTAQNLEAALQEIETSAGAMMDLAQERADTLGPHFQALSEAIQTIQETTKAAAEPIDHISTTLNTVADNYEEVIASDPFGDMSGGGKAGIGAAAVGAAAAVGLGVLGGAAAGRAAAACAGKRLDSGGGGAIGSVTTQNIETIKTWIEKVNPHYGNPFLPESGRNCGSCALTVAKRLNGDTTATASLTNIGTDSGMEQATGKSCVYMSLSEMENLIRSKGAGSHFIVGINRTFGAGHWFNAYYDGQKIYTIDGQCGKVFEWPHDYGHIAEWCILT